VRFLLIAASVFLSLSAAAHAELAGAAVIISGDTIEVQGRRVRLYGVTAPGFDQLCVGARGQWRCGVDSIENTAAGQSTMPRRVIRPASPVLCFVVVGAVASAVRPESNNLDTVTRNHRQPTMKHLMSSVRRFMHVCQAWPGNGHGFGRY
jgi:hypothetical protein